MADPTVPHAMWEWMDWLWGAIMGAVAASAGLIGWVGPKFKEVHKQIEENAETAHIELDEDSKEIRKELQSKVDELHARITSNVILVTALQQNMLETMRMYERLETALHTLTKETQEQTKSLSQLKGKMGIVDT